jgi:hypothetical protein
MIETISPGRIAIHALEGLHPDRAGVIDLLEPSRFDDRQSVCIGHLKPPFLAASLPLAEVM